MKNMKHIKNMKNTKNARYEHLRYEHLRNENLSSYEHLGSYEHLSSYFNIHLSLTFSAVLLLATIPVGGWRLNKNKAKLNFSSN